MQKIIPCLWFDSEAEEAAKFYTSIFPNSEIAQLEKYNVETPSNKPIGSVMTVEFELDGYRFLGLNGGPYFEPNPSISFHVKCKTKDQVDAIWQRLSKQGKVLMALDKYPFSERYGWVQDKYGFSWQIIFVGESEMKQRITPVLMFVGNVCGKAEEAVNSYTSVFHNAKANILARYGKGEEQDKEGTVKYAHFTLEGQEFGAMDSAREHKFAFNESISFMVYCDTQREIDYYWNKLSAVPEAEQCGWLKDKYGLSWQIVPTSMDEMMSKGTKRQIARVTEAFLKMKKFDIAKLKEAYEGK
jgi:predicted 3-demethylubiquinone-9 3-methyltransferase (glyoxalase superfamily)